MPVGLKTKFGVFVRFGAPAEIEVKEVARALAW
jgi:hypothetical protein